MYVGNFKIYLIYRGYDDLEINNLILHKTLLVSRDIDGALHDCEEQKKNYSGFCNRKYNKQTKVNEILASPYERQRTQTDMFFRIPYCVIQTHLIPYFIIHK